MAIKVALVAALLVGLVALASATSYTTTVITTSYDEEGGRRSQQCRQQVQGRQFRSCQSYLTQRRSSPYEDEAEIDVEANPQRQQRESVEECCQQLRQMDRNQCGCEAIKHAVRQVQQGGSHRSYQKRADVPEGASAPTHVQTARAAVPLQRCFGVERGSIGEKGRPIGLLEICFLLIQNEFS